MVLLQCEWCVQCGVNENGCKEQMSPEPCESVQLIYDTKKLHTTKNLTFYILKMAYKS